MFLWHVLVERLKVTVTNHKDLNDVPHNLRIESYGKFRFAENVLWGSWTGCAVRATHCSARSDIVPVISSTYTCFYGVILSCDQEGSIYQLLGCFCWLWMIRCEFHWCCYFSTMHCYSFYVNFNVHTLCSYKWTRCISCSRFIVNTWCIVLGCWEMKALHLLCVRNCITTSWVQEAICMSVSRSRNSHLTETISNGLCTVYTTDCCAKWLLRIFFLH